LGKANVSEKNAVSAFRTEVMSQDSEGLYIYIHRIAGKKSEGKGQTGGRNWK
jgi:hypothetical protein